MTIEEHYLRLQKYALGWIGWDEESAMAADVNAIEIAVEGRQDMLRAIFAPSKGKDETKPVTKENLRDMGQTKKGLK